MGFKMKGMTFGVGTGSEKPKTISDIERDASSEVAMDSAMDRSAMFKKDPLDVIAEGSKPPISEAEQKINEEKEKILSGNADHFELDPRLNKDNEQSFGDAFAAARKAGKKEFTWKGKKYHTRTKEEEDARKKDNAKSSGDDSTKSSGNDNKSMERKLGSAEIARPDYQKRRQERRIARRKGKAGKDPVYDARTAKKEARMKYGRNSKEFKEANQALQDAKANR